MTFARLFDRTTVAFSTPEVSRVFLACRDCGRVKPHYEIYPAIGEIAKGQCRCGHTIFRPKHIPEWHAACRLLVIGWFWRGVVRRKSAWDPRMPIRYQA